MIKVIRVLLIHSLSSIYNCGYGQSLDLKSVTIRCVDFKIETIADISCGTFDNYLNDGEKKLKFIFKKADLFQFQSLLKESILVKSLQSFDVRGSVNFIYGKASDKYCFNKFGYFYKDGKYYFNRSLLIFITDKIYTHHPEYLDKLRQE